MKRFDAVGTPALAATWVRPPWPLAEIVRAKRGRTVSVVLPALDEEDTVAGVVSSITPHLGGLIDEVVVLDSGSTDRTAQRARGAGATVVSREEALPGTPVVRGKGEVLWRGVAATSGDIVVFVDSDLVEPGSHFVPSLVGPLLMTEGLELVKGFYRRPLTIGDSTDEDGGGRVTQLTVRPLLTALVPELAGVFQPLGGEYAATRQLLESLRFAPGYGVEIGLLLDTYHRLGASAIGQIGLGTRRHRNRPTSELAVMSRQIVATMFSRLGLTDSGAGFTTFETSGNQLSTKIAPLSLVDRPPLITLDQYTRTARRHAMSQPV
ncbi:glucosyl-3-phosphoglycerate synthase [Rhodococcus cercidiphylli]|uniref:Glucosyl-3-phosphoglycerate synthase n=1 Tax=Rhodococcus cercidiphylli TaxID=489916 RepID=A0ABU4AY16_9NOCA|nr:glucosyl-3-phosphoglycerate synthase [Rhodococcus cercidiphylli]MDV6231120.1 glucosyl-3-phosphoglycerate synthase [Rhodococcus cercidiphylli]